MTTMYPEAPLEMDKRDQMILAERVAELATIDGPRVGDFVEFSDGVERRISHHWGDSIQTSDGGSWHLGDGYCNFSGSLHPGVPVGTLTDTGETKLGAVWFFHHNIWRAHNGVNASAPFRVFSCSEKSTR